MQISKIFFIIIIVGSLLLAGCTNKQEVKKEINCTLNNCHGLSASCTSEGPEVCTQEYQIGDFCRKYIDCYVSDGKCITNYTKTYRECKACVSECLDKAMPFECEQECREQIEK